jgi:hypothetical protein
MFAELILDFLPWPGSGEKSKERGDALMGKALGGAVLVDPRRPDAIKDALVESGWLAEPVVAAGDLRQGKEPSLVSMVTGTALIEVMRPRRSKAVPRHFVLAVTAERVVAFGAVGGGEEDGPYEVWVRPGERGAWPRESVRLIDTDADGKSWSGTLVLGQERVPVFRPGSNTDPSTDELIELLAG